MNNNLSEPISQQVEQQLSSPLTQSKKGNNLPPKFLLIILGILLVVLSVEGVLLVVMKNKNKGYKAESVKKGEISEEKVTPIPTRGADKEIESSWNGKKTTLIKGKVSSFDVNGQKINLVLGDNTTKTVAIDDKTVFLSIERDEEQIAPLSTKTVGLSDFFKALKEGETINASCYDNGIAVFVTKIINYKNQK